MALERLKTCRSATELAAELGIHRTRLYKWRDQKSRGSTPEQQRLWREGVYDQIRELMPMQGSLSVERMCGLERVSRVGFYR